jgi:replication factor C subunit 3/5
MAYPEVNEANVYSCTGKPLPSEIAQILEWLFNSNFEECFKSIFIVYVEVYVT